jgi:hypothetical protein
MLKIPVRSKNAVFSAVLAVALATISATSVFAATATTPMNRDLATLWGSQFRDLQADRTIYNNIKSHPAEIKNASKPAEVQQYLDQYAFALKQAEAIVLHGSPSGSAIVKVNNRFEDSLTAQQELATYLHMMRGLREKLGLAI